MSLGRTSYGPDRRSHCADPEARGGPGKAVTLPLILPAAVSAVPARARRRIVTVDPGRLHAALLQKERNPESAANAFVHAAASPDLAARLNRIAAFYNRAADPANRRLRIYAAPGCRERLRSGRTPSRRPRITLRPRVSPWPDGRSHEVSVAPGGGLCEGKQNGPAGREPRIQSGYACSVQPGGVSWPIARVQSEFGAC